MTGLIQDSEELLSFFRALEDEPRDLLGPAHQRLLMHCFSELVSLDNRPSIEHLIAETELKLKEWAVFEWTNLKLMRLCHEIEFPEHILSSMLEEEYGSIEIFLRALSHRPQLSSRLLSQVEIFLPKVDSRTLCEFVQGLQSSVPDSILQTLLCRLEDTYPTERDLILRTLSWISPLPGSILQALVHRLDDPDLGVRVSASIAIGQQRPLEDSIIQKLASRLEDTDSQIKQNAIRALSRISPLPESILQALVYRLDDPDPGVMLSASIEIRRQCPLEDSILRKLASPLEGTDTRIKQATLNTLMWLSPLPDSILQTVVHRLEDIDPDIRVSALNTLIKHSSL